MLFFIVATSTHIPTNKTWGFSFLLINTFFFCLFDKYSFWKVWSCLKYWFSHSWWLGMLTMFSCVCWLSVCLPWKKYLFRSFLHLYLGVLFAFDVELHKFLLYFGYHSFNEYIIYKYLVPSVGFCFFLNSFPSLCKTF